MNMTQKLNTGEGNNLSDLSKRFLRIIDKMGYSHYRIAKETKIISNSILTHIKSGRSEPSVKVISALLEKFPNVNANWLLTGKGAMFLDDNNPVLTNKTKTISEKESGNNDFKELLKAKNKMIAIAEKMTTQNQKIIEYFKTWEIGKMIKETKEEVTREIKKTKED